VKRALTAAGLAALAVATAAPGLAATAYMDGLGNVGPGWTTITMPDGSRCATGCNEVTWNYWSTGGTNGSTAAAGAWMDANNTPDSILYTYSLSAVGANEARAARPDWQGRLVEVGSPARPNNGATYEQGGRPLLQVGGGQVDYLSVEGDEAAVRKKRLFGTHTSGYRNRDFSKETPLEVNQPAPNVTDRVYADPPKTSWLASLFKPASTTKVTAARTATAELDAPAAPTRAEKRAQARAERAAARQARTQHVSSSSADNTSPGDGGAQ
jgi:hypothetical protein